MLALNENATSAAAHLGTAREHAPRPVPSHTMAHAARHDILRRLAPALRHDMVVNLQSVGMMAEALSARLERGNADTDEMQAAMSKLNRLTRRAVEACVEVATWMDPAENDATPLNAGIEETARLLRSGLNFRGFTLTHVPSEDDFLVARCALRFLLPAAILMLCDSAPEPGELTITADTSATHAVLAITFSLVAKDPDEIDPLLPDTGERPLFWPDVRALAECESVEIRRHEGQVILRFPRTVATSPLKLVPVI